MYAYSFIHVYYDNKTSRRLLLESGGNRMYSKEGSWEPLEVRIGRGKVI